MEFLRAEGSAYLFQITEAERRLLEEIAKLYPLLPPAYHRLSNDAPTPPLLDAQKWLEESLSEQHREVRQRFLRLIRQPDRWTQREEKTLWRLEAPEVEWLLQAFNDVRVGSWVILGAPDELAGKWPDYNEKTLPYLLAMETCGELQTLLLRALHSSK